MKKLFMLLPLIAIALSSCEKPGENAGSFTTSLKVTNVTTNSVTLSWDPVQGSIRVYYVYVVGDHLFYGSTNETTYTVSGLKENTTYEFYVSTFYYPDGNVAIGLYSQTVEATTLANYGGGTESGLYLGVIGFNEYLYTPVAPIKTIRLLNNGTKSSFTSFVNVLEMKDNTALYLAVDNGLGMLQNSTMPDDLESVSIVTFTDGLDNASAILNTAYLGDPDRYRNDIQNAIKTTKYTDKNIPIDAYTVGVKGGNVRDDNAFTITREALASNKDNAILVDDINKLTTTFEELAKSLSEESRSQNLRLRMPGGYKTGDKIRFTFDNIDDAANSNAYIEGTFNPQNNFALENIVYYGVSSSSESIIYGSTVGANVYYAFEDVGNLSPTNSELWIYRTSSQIWEPDSEFGKTGDTEIIIDKKSAVIILVLDCTTSLDDNGANGSTIMKNAANSFIEILAESTQ